MEDTDKSREEVLQEESVNATPEESMMGKEQDFATQSDTDDDCAKEVAELKDKNLRLYAEFENYRKRTTKEKLDLIKTASQDILSSLLPILDDFDRAAKVVEGLGEKDAAGEGLLLVHQKLSSLLKSKGLEPLVSDLEVYDPELHEAITTIPAPTPELKGKVLDTVMKGYLLNDKLIRHAKVVVGE
jgi:molecular chaperone GrpE